MHLDVIDLKKFYYRTKLGVVVQNVLTAELQEVWRDVKGQTVAGFGFANPVLRPYLKDARRVLSLMPGAQGVMAWPRHAPNCAVLMDETRWPIATGRIDKLVVLHGLETSDNQGELLSEIWRVLGPGGSVVFVVPNRSGLWVRSDKTPFGFGRPYSMSQLETQLRTHGFDIESHKSAMFFPPSEKRRWLRLQQLFERVGKGTGLPIAAGVVLVEATKSVFAMPKGGAGVSVKTPLEVLDGIRAPAGKPVGNIRGARRGGDVSKVGHYANLLIYN
ncbi:MAG: methyltransferase domain-containing protein [Pseudomonadota bacterium]